MTPKKRIFISILILIGLIVVFYFVTYGVTQLTGRSISQSQTKELEECLEKQDITLYIKSDNTDTELKRNDLFEYMRYFKIQNCINNNKPCDDNSIDYFPTWIINNKKIVGYVSISELEVYSNCNTL